MPIGTMNIADLPFDADGGPACETCPQDVVQRLRAVRRKVGRWLPSSDALALWSVDYAEVYRSATRLESAVRALDAHLKTGDAEFSPSASSADLQLLLCTLEERADAFEASVIENLSVTAGRRAS